MNFNPPKGTDDIFPPAARAWRETLIIWERLAERYGYDLVIGPVFESTDLFQRHHFQQFRGFAKMGSAATHQPGGLRPAFINNGHNTVAHKIACKPRICITGIFLPPQFLRLGISL